MISIVAVRSPEAIFTAKSTLSLSLEEMLFAKIREIIIPSIRKTNPIVNVMFLTSIIGARNSSSERVRPTLHPVPLTGA